MPERGGAQIADRVHRPRSHDIVFGLTLLQHAPHRVDVVAGKSPVAPRIEIAEPQLVRFAQLDAGDGVADLARHELEPAARRFMIEEDAADGEHPV